MKNNLNLYFDTWRKANFLLLVKIYTNLFKSKESSLSADILKPRLGENLKVYFPNEKEKNITDALWRSAYTLGLELGIFFRVETKPARYNLSDLGNRLQKSQITAPEFLASYLLNLNQLINDQVVHPLETILDYMHAESIEQINRNNVIEIPSFNLQREGNTEDNQRTMANVLIHRLIDSNIFTEVSFSRESGKTIKLSDKYSLDEIRQNINKFQGSTDEFKEMNAQRYVEMISSANNLIK
jgi:hypothetical protein